MDLTKLIKDKVKQDKVLLGYKSVMRLIKSGRPELVVYANNIPEDRKKILEHNTKIANVKIQEYPNDGVNLGLVCGKPFPVSVLAIKRGKK
jgi:large subunit ribosomal protein L30e